MKNNFMKIRRNVSTKKVSLAMLLLLNISMISAVAQAVDTETPADILQMSGRINDIQSTVDNLVQTMSTSPDPGSEINISDYLVAKAALMETIQTETDLFKRCVVQIRDTVRDTVRVLDQELADLRVTYRVTRASGIQDLIRIKERGRSGAIQSLEESVQNQYEGCIKQLVTLNFGIRIVTGISDPHHLLGKRLGLGVLAPTVVGVFAVAVFSRDTSSDHFYGELFMGRGPQERSGDLQLRRFRAGSRRAMNDLSARLSSPLFEKCESQACVFLLGDLYQIWLRQVRDVNRDLDLIENVELKAVSMTRSRKIARLMTNIIEITASRRSAVILPRGQAPRVEESTPTLVVTPDDSGERENSEDACPSGWTWSPVGCEYSI